MHEHYGIGCKPVYALKSAVYGVSTTRYNRFSVSLLSLTDTMILGWRDYTRNDYRYWIAM